MTVSTLRELFDSASKWTVQAVTTAQRVESGDFVVLDKGMERFSSLEEYNAAQWHGGPGGDIGALCQCPWLVSD